MPSKSFTFRLIVSVLAAELLVHLWSPGLSGSFAVLYEPRIYPWIFTHFSVVIVCGIAVADGWSRLTAMFCVVLCLVSSFLAVNSFGLKPNVDFTCVGVDFLLGLLAWKIRVSLRSYPKSKVSWPWRLFGWIIPALWSAWVALELLWAEPHTDSRLTSVFHWDMLALPMFLAAQGMAVLGFAGGPSYAFSRYALRAYAFLQSSQLVARVVNVLVSVSGQPHGLAVALLKSEIADSLPLLCLIAIWIFSRMTSRSPGEVKHA